MPAARFTEHLTTLLPEAQPLARDIFYRVIPKHSTGGPLEPGYSFMGGRYNRKEQLSALYFCDSQSRALPEASGRPDTHSVYEARVQIPKILALDLAQLSSLNLTLSDVTRPPPRGYDLPQEIGMAAFDAGWNGLLVPSALPGATDATNLVIFPGRVLYLSGIQILRAV